MIVTLKNNKWKVALGVVIALVLIARATLPGIILKKTNEFLHAFSPVYDLHIRDMDLGIIRGAYKFQGFEAKLKSNNDVFLQVETIDVSVAWREIFRGRVVTDIVVDGAKALLTDNVIKAARNAPKPPAEEAETVKDKLFPVKIERVIVSNSSVQIAEVPKVAEAERWQLSDIQTRISNLTPSDNESRTLLTFKATFMGSAAIKAVGELKLLAKPKAWDMDVEMRGFDLVAANPVLKRVLPFTFTSGHLDGFAEVKSQGGKIEGYVKPFLRKVDVVGKNDFQGPKHFFIEVAGALGNLIFRRSGEKTVATKIPFKTEGEAVKVDTGAAIANAIEHGFGDKIAPSLEESVHL